MEKLNVISIISSSEVVAYITNLSGETIQISKPVNLESSTDVLDAPLNPDDFLQGLELVKVLFQTGGAILVFCNSLIDILKKTKSKAVIKIENNEKVIDETISPDELKKIIEK